MWIKREIEPFLDTDRGNYIQVVIGPRQIGKSSLLSYLGRNQFREIEFDDFQMRTLASQDPGLFISQNPPPLILDEVQYVPNLFPALKQVVDQYKKKRLLGDAHEEPQLLYRLTGSNLILLSREVRETLVGRAAYYYMNTLSVSEIRASFPELPVGEIIFRGGWPEIYSNPHLKVVRFLNDYISNYLEKDLAKSAGIERIREFYVVLGLAAARVGQLLNYADLAKDSGVQGVTVKSWLGLLEQSFLVATLHPYESNLNKRLIKTPKLYFWDTGLATRLQGWPESVPMQQSPQVGQLFENLVFAEILKCCQNHQKDWKIYFWRTKEGEEVDFLVQLDHQRWLAFDAKWGVHVKPKHLPKSFRAEFPQISKIVLVTPSAMKGARKLAEDSEQISIDELSAYLLQADAR